jgi:hypothetical protein
MAITVFHFRIMTFAPFVFAESGVAGPGCGSTINLQRSSLLK